MPLGGRLSTRSVSQDSVYTILIRLPPDGGSGDERAPSIKMIQDDVPLSVAHLTKRIQQSQKSGEYTVPVCVCAVLASNYCTTFLIYVTGDENGDCNENDKARTVKLQTPALPLNRRISHAPDIRIPLNAKVISKPIGKPQPVQRQAKKKKKSQEKRQETKAAKTLSAILLSFIITWTPYNILVLLKPLTACTKCIPQELWDFFYALCYINSTINPMCYALCNASFRRTYVRILTCKWHTRNREAMTRGVYN